MIIHFKKYISLSRKHNIPLNVTQKICDSEFSFVKEIIKADGDEPIRLQYLGQFLVKPGRRAHVQNNNAKAKKMRDGKKGRQKK